MNVNAIICSFYDIIEEIEKHNPTWDLDKVETELYEYLQIAIQDFKDDRGIEEE